MALNTHGTPEDWDGRWLTVCVPAIGSLRRTGVNRSGSFKQKNEIRPVMLEVTCDGKKRLQTDKKTLFVTATADKSVE